MVDLNAAGTFAVVNSKTYKFNVDDPTLTDANGVTLPASAYFTNTLTSGPTVSCSGSPKDDCATSNQPDTPSPPAPDPSKVTGPTGACQQQRCTFLDGGTLTGFTYTQSVTIKGKNGKGNWTFTWTYTVAPDPTKDVDSNTAGVQVNSFTAWVLVSETNNLAEITVTAEIAGESVVKNNTVGTKYSFSLRNPDGSSRVTDLKVYVNGALVATPGSTLEENCPECLAGDPGAVDFTYTTNAGSNGTTSLLKDGDARTILNTDSFPGNDNGGADGRALAKAVMDPVKLELPPGQYTVTLTGTVKGNNGLASIDFSVTQTIQIITPGCGGG